RWRIVDQYAVPVNGNMLVSEMETDDKYKILRPLWDTKFPTAKKLRGQIRRIIAYSIGIKKRPKGPNPAATEFLTDILPKPREVHQTEHHPTIAVSKAKAFVSELRKRNGNAARALQFVILTAARSGEVRGATWDEIDLKKGRWLV